MDVDDLDSQLSTSSSSNASISSQTSNRSIRIAERERRKKEADDPFVVAMDYFSNLKAGTAFIGNHVLENNLALVESVAYSKGLPPEAISVMLELTMSTRLPMGSRSNVFIRVLKCLIPATVVPQEAVCRAVVWIFVGKIPTSAQVLFLKWVLTMYDMIDSKEYLRSMYGFLFSLVTDSDLWPYMCHLLCLLTRKESVRLYRVRKLLELQTKLGQQPVLIHLLALYKMFCPELVQCSFSSKMRVSFKNYNSSWKTSLAIVQKNNACTVASICLPSGVTAKKTKSRKRKHGAHLELPMLRAAAQMETQNDPFHRKKLVPMIQIQSFSELLNNLGNIELPAQMGSLLGSHLALHYLDCVLDDSAYLRLNAWVGNALAEEFLCCSDEEHSSSEEAVQYLERLHSVQSFLQEGLSSTEIFLNSFLSVWDGSHLRPQILNLLSFYPVVPMTHMKQLLFEPIMQLFCTSTVFFKCSVIDGLKNMLQRWLNWHLVYAVADSNSLDINLHSLNTTTMTLSVFKDSVMEVVNFVGRLSSLGLQLEHCHSLILSISLDFYEMVCDVFLKYGLPLVVMPPKGVFYPALLGKEPISVDRMANIMYRYKMNLTAAKEQRQTQNAHFSRQTLQEFNYYAICMINCLWNIKPGKRDVDLPISAEQLSSGKIPGFDLSHHPAFLIYAIEFHRQCWPESRDMDLNSIKTPKVWCWYLEYLYARFEGLKRFANSMIHQRESRVMTPLKQGK